MIGKERGNPSHHQNGTFRRTLDTSPRLQTRSLLTLSEHIEQTHYDSADIRLLDRRQYQYSTTSQEGKHYTITTWEARSVVHNIKNNFIQALTVVEQKQAIMKTYARKSIRSNMNWIISSRSVDCSRCSTRKSFERYK